MYMRDGTTGLQFERLQVGQAVEVRRGSLAGVVGLFSGFSPNHKCIIQLDTLPGVTLIIDPAAVGALDCALGAATPDRIQPRYQSTHKFTA